MSPDPYIWSPAQAASAPLIVTPTREDAAHPTASRRQPGNLRLEHFRPQGLLDARIAYAEKARTIGRVGKHSGLEHADDLENPQRVVGDVHFLGGKDIDRFVLTDRRSQQ